MYVAQERTFPQKGGAPNEQIQARRNHAPER